MDAPLRCFHCGDALGADAATVMLDGAAMPVCCEGCGAAARWIRDSGLGDYYRLRQARAARVQVGDDDYSEWMHADIQREHVRMDGPVSEISLVTDAMRCAACAWLIDRALTSVEGVDEVTANAVTGRIRLRWDAARVALPLLLRRLATLGFAPYLATGAMREDELRRRKRLDVLRLGVAGLGAMQAMMFAEALYLDFDAAMPLATRDFLRWIAFLVSTPVVFFSGWPFIAGALRELRARHVGMDALVASSVLLAYGASLVETLRGAPHVWFDAAVMFVFLLLLARQLEAWVRRRAAERVDTLARARPALARRESAEGQLRSVPLAALRVDDVLQVPAGEAVPADGLLLDAPASFDESLLTGESAPVPHAPGDAVLAGSFSPHAPVRLRVTRTGQDTQLAELVRLVEQAQAARPRLARLADRVASRFVVAIFVVAAAVFVAWMNIDPTRAFEITLAVLVVTCPCALSLAIPAAVASATGQLARLGVLTLRADALETLAQVDAIVFDKTGTLSAGRPTLVAVDAFPGTTRDEASALAAALQRESRHPLAHAFASVAPAPVAVEALTLVPGAGVEARLDGRMLRLGRADFATQHDDDGAVWLGCDGEAMARFELGDAARAEAPAALAALRALGLEAELCSGDGAPAVASLARELGIARFAARQLPADKLARVRALQAQGRRVAMVGDGINDAPVLAGADVSFALGGGAAIAHRAADFVLGGDALLRLPQTIALARRMRRIVRQNLAWAIAYNLVALPFAALGWVAPWLAAIGMAASSLLVTLNSLRLAREPR